MTGDLSCSNAVKVRPPRKLRQRHERGELRAVVDETIALFHRLRFVAELIYGEQGRSTARRGVLRGLARFGPQTVPQLARTRKVSRQHLREVVQALERAGLVVRVPNPRHARSQIVEVTARGRQLVAQMDQTDAQVLWAAAGHLSRAELEITARTLKRMREGFEQARRWRG